MPSIPLSRTLTNSSISSFSPSHQVDPNSAWSLTVVRAIGLERLRPGGGKVWKPLVSISVNETTPKSFSKNTNSQQPSTEAYETLLGTDGQNPNLKVPFYLPYHSSDSRLSISVFHTPPSKKKGRSSRRTAVASASSSTSGSSCPLSLGNLWSKQQHFEDSESGIGMLSNERGLSFVNIQLTPHAPQKRTSNGSVSSRGKSSSHNISNAPMLVLKLVPPAKMLDRLPLRMITDADNTDGSIIESSVSDNSDFDDHHVESPIQEDGENTPLLPPTDTQPENEIRRRLRKQRRVTGFCVDSDEEVASCSASDSSDDEEDVKYNNEDSVLGSSPLPHDEGYYSDNTKVDAESPGYIVRFIAFASTLPVYTPRPTANSSIFTDDADEKLTMPDWVKRIVSIAEYILASFTLYDSLRTADAMRDDAVGEGSKRDAFNAVFLRMQVEWTYVGGLLVALAALDTAVFSIEPGSSGLMFEVDDISRAAVAASCMSAGLGLACDSWFLIRYNWADLDTFITRARDLFDTYFFFALAARLPGILLSISSLSILTFFARVAFTAWPVGSIILCGLVGFVMSLQFLVFGFVRGFRGVGRAGRACRRLVVRNGRRGGPVGGSGGLQQPADAEGGLRPPVPPPPVVSLRSIPPMVRR